MRDQTRRIDFPLPHNHFGPDDHDRLHYYVMFLRAYKWDVVASCQCHLPFELGALPWGYMASISVGSPFETMTFVDPFMFLADVPMPNIRKLHITSVYSHEEDMRGVFSLIGTKGIRDVTLEHIQVLDDAGESIRSVANRAPMMNNLHLDTYTVHGDYRYILLHGVHTCTIRSIHITNPRSDTTPRFEFCIIEGPLRSSLKSLIIRGFRVALSHVEEILSVYDLDTLYMPECILYKPIASIDPSAREHRYKKHVVCAQIHTNGFQVTPESIKGMSILIDEICESTHGDN